ncbi:MAG: hypothetical protein M1832_001780 [Thelocarpon impressellum]|nr:MAG: hypothetical protein M1832_001780 [Thelocarpon impressellum]
MPEALPPSNGRKNAAPQKGSANDPFFEDLSSMSTLVSAAQAHGKQIQSQPLDPQHMIQPDASNSFQDLDGPLNLYGDLEVQTPLHSYVGHEETGEEFMGDVDRNGATSTLREWYGQEVGDGPSELSDDYQNIPKQRQPEVRHHVSNGYSSQSQPEQTADAKKPRAPFPLKGQGEADDTLGGLKDEGPAEVRDLEKSVFSSTLSSLGPSAPTPDQTPSPNEAEPGSQQLTHSVVRTIAEPAPARLQEDFRPKTSIPTHLQPEDYARECIVAAYSSRLNPYSLHHDEYRLLRGHLTHQQVTSYLNIRNGILRLWIRNPLVAVTREEAAGCARDSRWFDAADVAYQWLLRRGYINFGCVEVPDTAGLPVNGVRQDVKPRRKTVVVIGAGMAGLGCARQLEGLFAQLGEHWTAKGEEIPKVVVLEGRGRIGGRVYSHPLRKQATENLPAGLRCTADMGAQIITGFDHGNPLSAVIRGQLGLHFHLLKDNSILHDSDGSVVDKDRDQLVEKLYNDILDRASVYRHKVPAPATVEGERELIELGRDPGGEGGKLISVVEDGAAPIPPAGSGAESTRTGSTGSQGQVAAGVDKLTGRLHTTPGPSTKAPAARTAVAMGWVPKAGVTPSTSLALDEKAKLAENPTLGSLMDEAAKQYQDIVDLTPQDMRLLNWHYANLEYANAANVGDLSLGGWDQDIGNEFEGEHAEIVGGYMQVPRGIWQSPFPLDVRTRRAVEAIRYGVASLPESPAATVICEDGEVLEADRIVSTMPLGVLKAQNVQFEPILPDWKTGAIKRLGFGTLNKVVLVYEHAFWDKERDMFGLLRDPSAEGSLDQADYVQNRGRFYLFWNCIKTSGRPMLVALMAGDAAHQTESSNDYDLVSEATSVLRKMFAGIKVPAPQEVIITRWGKDRFARGSYSYVGPESRAEDYDLMAKSVGNLHFAGEATCGTHPATVHGAYLSGLRAASEVVEAMIGPIEIRTPLIPAKVQVANKASMLGAKRKAEAAPARVAQDVDAARVKAHEAEVSMFVYERLGERPTKPGKSGANPFLLYQKDHWHLCKSKCDEAHKHATKDPEAKAGRNEVRAALGQMWREAPEAEKKPYQERTANNKESNAASLAEFNSKLAQWDRDAELLRLEYTEKHREVPRPVATASQSTMRPPDDGEHEHTGRRVRKRASYAEDSDMDLD